MFLELLLPVLLQGATAVSAEDLEPESALPTQATPPEDSEDASSGVADDNDDIVVSGEAPKPEQKICHYEKTIGSGIKKKVCRTESQIKAEAVAARNNANTMSGEMRTRSASGWNETR